MCRSFLIVACNLFVNNTLIAMEPTFNEPITVVDQPQVLASYETARAKTNPHMTITPLPDIEALPAQPGRAAGAESGTPPERSIQSPEPTAPASPVEPISTTEICRQRAPRRTKRLTLGKLAAAGTHYTGNCTRADITQAQLRLAQTIRLADGRLEYKNVTHKIRRSRKPILFVLQHNGRVCNAPRICVTPPADNEFEPEGPLHTDFLLHDSTECIASLDDPGENIDDCLHQFYALLRKNFIGFDHCSDVKRAAWAAYAIATLKNYERRLYDICRTQPGRSESSLMLQASINVTTTQMRHNLATIIGTCPPCPKALDTKTKDALVGVFGALHQTILDQNGCTLEMVASRLRQYPAAREVLACAQNRSRQMLEVEFAL